MPTLTPEQESAEAPTTKLSPDEENEIAGGYDPAEEALITQENQLAQSEAEATPVPVPEKASVRGLSTLLIVGCVMGMGLAVWFLFFGGDKSSAKKATSTATPSPSPTATVTGDDALKAELAFARQRQAVDEARKEEEAASKLKQPAKTSEGGKKDKDKESKKERRSSASRSTSPARSARSTSNRQPRSRSRSSTPPRSSAKSAPASKPVAAEDPFQRWERLSSTGQTNYLEGKDSKTGGSSIASTPGAAETLVASTGSLPSISPAAMPVSPSAVIPVVSINLSGREPSDRPGSSLGMTPGELNILNRAESPLIPVSSTEMIDSPEFSSSPQEILIGSMVTGKVKVPIAWANEQALGNGVIELSEPLLDKNGAVVFPKGTMLIARAEPIDSDRSSNSSEAPAALLKINIIGAIVKRPDGEIKQFPLAQQAMTVQAQDGGPIQAKISGSRPPALVSGNDLFLVAVGGAAKAGEILNEPEVTSSSSVSDFTSQQSTVSRSREPNLVGALFEGGFSPVADLIKGRISRRDSYAEDQRKKTPTYYVVQQGSSVVIVVQSFIKVE